MKKQPINFSWPAKLSDFSKDEQQENFSRCGLSVFYKGETEDHRFFSDDFSEKLAATVLYAPVVANYDSEKDDFVGHATEQQILGIVDPCIEPTFSKGEDGNVWLNCSVVLYTERPDKVGELAKKVVGHKQSLELNPKTVKYVVNYDEKKHFKNIEFTAGDIIGVSVLGNDQKPAFTGSEFFEYNEEFEKKMKMLREYCENRKEGQTQNGGESMDLNEFMKLSWGDVSLKVDECICKEYGNDAYTYVVDMFSDSAIVRFFYYIEGTQKLMRIKYSIAEDGSVELGAINEVHMTYEDIIETPNMVDDANDMSVAGGDNKDAEENEKSEEDKKSKKEQSGVDASEPASTETDCACGDKKEKCEKCGKSKEDCECGKPEKEKCECGDKKPEDEEKCATCGKPKAQCECGGGKDKKDESDCSCGPKKDENCECNNESVTNSEDSNSIPAKTFNVESNETTIGNEDTPDDKKASVEENGKDFTSKEDNSSSTSSFAESERAELEALRREKKVMMINSYKDSLTEEQIADFTAQIDTIDEKDLELELLKAYKNSVEEDKPVRRAAFMMASPKENKGNDSPLDAFVRKNLRR